MPRTYLTAERNRLAGDYNVLTRVEVRDSDGTWRDLTAYSGSRNFFVSAKWSRTLDAPVMSGTVTFLRSVLGASLAPTITASIMNTNAASAYVPLLAGGRAIRISTACVVVGGVPVTADWKEMFFGRIDDPDWGGADDSTITCTISDLGAWLLGKNIDTERTYGLATGQPLETVIQNILNDNASGPLNALLGSAVTLYTPTSPGWNIKQFVQKKENVLTAIRTLAQQIGWDIRFVYDASNAYRLTLFQPQRTKTVADYSLSSAAEYYAIPQLAQNLGDVRTRIGGSYLDSATGTRLWRYAVADAAHLAQYDTVYMDIIEDDTSNIDTSVEMDKMLNAALSDLQDPWATQQAESPYFWLAELGDLVSWPANAVHYDSAQAMAIVAIEHTLDVTGETTLLTARGKVTGNVKEWLTKQGGGGAPTATPIEPPAALVTFSSQTGTTATLSLSGVDNARTFAFQWRTRLTVGSTPGAWSAWSTAALPASLAVTRDVFYSTLAELQVQQGDGQQAIYGVTVDPSTPSLDPTTARVKRGFAFDDTKFGMQANDTGGTQLLTTGVDSYLRPVNTYLVKSTGAGAADTADGVAPGSIKRIPLVGATDSGGNVDFSGTAFVNKNTDFIGDATGSPLSGGKRGFATIDSLNRVKRGNGFDDGNYGASATNAGGTSLISTAVDNFGRQVNAAYFIGTHHADDIVDGSTRRVPLTAHLDATGLLKSAVDYGATIAGIQARTVSRGSENSWRESFITNPGWADAGYGLGVQTIVSGAPGSTGSTALQVATQGSGIAARMPFNPKLLYRLRVRVCCTVNATTGTVPAQFYAGMWQYDYAGGSIGVPVAWTIVAASPLTVASGWVTYEGWVKGVAAGSGSGSGASTDPTAPATMHYQCTSWAPVWITNYASSNSTMQLDYFEVMAFDEDAANRTYQTVASTGNIKRARHFDDGYDAIKAAGGTGGATLTTDVVEGVNSQPVTNGYYRGFHTIDTIATSGATTRALPYTVIDSSNVLQTAVGNAATVGGVGAAMMARTGNRVFSEAIDNDIPVNWTTAGGGSIAYYTASALGSIQGPRGVRFTDNVQIQGRIAYNINPNKLYKLVFRARQAGVGTAAAPYLYAGILGRLGDGTAANNNGGALYVLAAGLVLSATGFYTEYVAWMQGATQAFTNNSAIASYSSGTPLAPQPFNVGTTSIIPYVLANYPGAGATSGAAFDMDYFQIFEVSDEDASNRTYQTVNGSNQFKRAVSFDDGGRAVVSAAGNELKLYAAIVEAANNQNVSNGYYRGFHTIDTIANSGATTRALPFTVIDSANNLLTGISGQNATKAAASASGIYFSEDFSEGGYWGNIWNSANAIGTLLTMVANLGQTGGNVLQITGMDWRSAPAAAKPYNPTKVYRMRARFRQTIDPTAGQASVYLGVCCYDKSGTQIGANYGSYILSIGTVATVAQGWKEITAYFTGANNPVASGSVVPAPDPTVAGFGVTTGTVYQGTAYIAPMWIFNYNAGNGTAQLDYFQIEEMDESVVGRTWNALDAGNNLRSTVAMGNGTVARALPAGTRPRIGGYQNGASISYNGTISPSVAPSHNVYGGVTYEPASVWGTDTQADGNAGAGGLAPSATRQVDEYTVYNLTTTSFFVRGRLKQMGGTPTGQTNAFPGTPLTSTSASAVVTSASAPSYNDVYTAGYSYSISQGSAAFGATSIDMTVSLDYYNGSSWISAVTTTYSASDPGTHAGGSGTASASGSDSLPATVSGRTSSSQFRLVIQSVTYTGIGTPSFSLSPGNLTYSTASGAQWASKTPNSTGITLLVDINGAS